MAAPATAQANAVKVLETERAWPSGPDECVWEYVCMLRVNKCSLQKSNDVFGVFLVAGCWVLAAGCGDGSKNPSSVRPSGAARRGK